MKSILLFASLFISLTSTAQQQGCWSAEKCTITFKGSIDNRDTRCAVCLEGDRLTYWVAGFGWHIFDKADSCAIVVNNVPAKFELRYVCQKNPMVIVIENFTQEKYDAKEMENKFDTR